jgi:hypothetical protein
MKAIAPIVFTCLSLAWLGACTPKDGKTDEDVAVATPLEPGNTADSLQLQLVAEQIQGDGIADVKALEAKINDPEAGLSAVDIDEDGVIDFVQVVEQRKRGKTVLVLQAIPSSKKGEDVSKIAVDVATIELDMHKPKAKDTETTIVVHATYTEHIHHDPEIHVYHHEVPVIVEHGDVVLAEGCFFHHVFVVEHEVYVGHHGHVVVEVHHDHGHHHKHKKHHKHHGHHGHHKHHGHHGGGVVVTF